MGVEPDPLVEEMLRARRHRRILVVAAAIGIVVGVTLAMGVFLGAMGSAVDGAARGSAAVGYLVVPVAACLTTGYVIYARRRRRAHP